MITVLDWRFVRDRCITVELTINDIFLAFMEDENKQIFVLV